MPIVQISLVSGRSPEQLRALVREVTKTVSTTVDAPIDTIRVLVNEIPPTHWGSGEQTIAEKRGGNAVL